MHQSDPSPKSRSPLPGDFAQQVFDHQMRVLSIGAQFLDFPGMLAGIIADSLMESPEFAKPARIIMDQPYGRISALQEATDEMHKVALQRLAIHVADFTRDHSILHLSGDTVHAQKIISLAMEHANAMLIADSVRVRILRDMFS